MPANKQMWRKILDKSSKAVRDSTFLYPVYYINRHDGKSEQNSRLDMTWIKVIKNQDKKLTKIMGDIHRQEKQDGCE